MSGIRNKYDEEFKKNAVKLSHASPKSAARAALDLDIRDQILYKWRTAEGNKTPAAEREEELKALRLELAEVKMGRGMLKKATACFASLHK